MAAYQFRHQYATLRMSASPLQKAKGLARCLVVCDRWVSSRSGILDQGGASSGLGGVAGPARTATTARSVGPWPSWMAPAAGLRLPRC